jgi:hypothetical protein
MALISYSGYENEYVDTVKGKYFLQSDADRATFTDIRVTIKRDYQYYNMHKCQILCDNPVYWAAASNVRVIYSTDIVTYTCIIFLRICVTCFQSVRYATQSRFYQKSRRDKCGRENKAAVPEPESPRFNYVKCVRRTDE